MPKGWDGQSKGTPWGYRFFVFFIKVLGLKASYLLLRLVVCYYWLFACSSNKALKQLYCEKLSFSRAQCRKLIYRNYYRKGQILLDQFVLMQQGNHNYHYTEEGEQLIHHYLEQGSGLVLLGSHMGAWNLAAHFLKVQGVKVNVVMYENERQAITKVMGELSEKVNIIPLSDSIDFILAVKLALQNNEVVCFNADRFVDPRHAVTEAFLGETALFPSGVFQLGFKLKVPMAYISGVKSGLRSYHFTCTPLEGSAPEDLLKTFVGCLEETVKRFPEQWFNYFDFWKKH